MEKNIFQEVKARADIMKVCDLLGIKLNKSNKCLCLFHKEKTPSFSVSKDKQIFYCFSCNKRWRCYYPCIRSNELEVIRCSKVYQ